MRRFLGCLACLMLSFSALGVEPRPYVDQPGLSAEELERMKEESKSNISRYGKDVAPNEEPFPWMSFGLGILTLLAVAPFAWSAYQRSANEIRERTASENPRASREE